MTSSCAAKTATSARQPIGAVVSKVESRMAKIYISGELFPVVPGNSEINGSYHRIGFKSPATISRSQETAQYDGTPGTLAARGRHDPCVVPRAVPIVEAMAALVVMDELLIQSARKSAGSLLPPTTTLPPTMVLPTRK